MFRLIWFYLNRIKKVYVCLREIVQGLFINLSLFLKRVDGACMSSACRLCAAQILSAAA